MPIRDTSHVRFAIATLIALPLIAAIALPLYFSGTPTLRANSGSPRVTISPTTAAFAVTLPTPTATSPAETTTRGVAAEPTRSPVAADPETAAAVEDLIADKAGVYGIIIADPSAGTRYSTNADVPFVAASLYKLVLLADIYAGIENGVIAADAELTLLPEYFPGPDEPPDSYYEADMAETTVTIDDALFATGAYSSNVGARALLALTDDGDLQAMAESLGMTHTHFHVDPRSLADWPPADVPEATPAALQDAIAFVEQQANDGPLMLTTPRDMEIYLDRLLAGRVVNAAVSARILEILKQQAVDDRFPCLLPPGTEMAHKTGNIDHVVHDVGIIWGADGPVILVAMVEDSPDDAEATLILQRLALVAYGEREIPTLEEAFASPETTCGILASEAEEVPAEDAVETDLEMVDPGEEELLPEEETLPDEEAFPEEEFLPTEPVDETDA